MIGAMEISKKVYIKGEHALQRLKNLEKIAQERFNGNFSEMTNKCWDCCFDLDPETGEPLSGKCPTGAPKRPIRRLRKM